MPIGTRLTGATSVVLLRKDYGSGMVGTSTYVQLTASLVGSVNRWHVFDSSGSALKIAVGAAGFEVDIFYIPPGGAPMTVDVFVPIGVRVSIKAVDTAASAGQLLMTGIA